MLKVAILGAGVNGLGCAVKVKEYFPNSEVVLFAKEFSPDTTGDGSAGLWYPYLCGDTPKNKLTKWGMETYKFMHRLWLHGQEGVILIPIQSLFREEGSTETLPAWRDKTFGFHVMTDKQLEYYSELYNTKYRFGYCFTTFTYEPTKLLSYLLRRFKDAGGVVHHRNVTSLEEPWLNDFDVVINCTGLGARELVPDDKMVPIRGQVARVTAEWITHAIMDETSGNYIIPNLNSCVLGGTHEENNYNLKISSQDADFIVNGCKTILPGIQENKIIKHWVGLRPGREEVRISSEMRNGELFIHNYGHGGSGVTLHWGCATEVLEILKQSLPKLKIHSKKSNL